MRGQVATEELLYGFVEGRRRISQKLVSLYDSPIGLLKIEVAGGTEVSASSNGSGRVTVSEVVQLLSNLAISVAEWCALGYDL